VNSQIWTRRCALAALLTSAAAGAAPALLAAVRSAPSPHYRWRGTALGARATIIIQGPDAGRAAALAPAWEAELRRLEDVFSLYREQSALRRLNRAGGLDAPPIELVDLLATCQAIHRATGGVFDPSVQPLWDLYATHFLRRPGTATGPDAESRARAGERVGFAHVHVAADRIEFGRAGMALTLNGIAQGYLSDRIAALLARAGVRHALVDIGEVRALGPRSGGDPWRVALARTGSGAPLTGLVEISGGALATSSPAGYRFGGHRGHHHLFDAAAGASAAAPRTVSVRAPTATLADGLSTAFAMLPAERIPAVVAAFPGVMVYPHPNNPEPRT